MKKYQFNVGEKTLKDYHKQVRNTKAKINRVKKQYGIDLSNEIDIPSLESFGSRKDFNEWKRNVESFRNRANTNYQFEKNQHGIVVSKRKLNELERLTKKAQKRVRKEIEKFQDKPFISGGQQQGTIGLQRPNKGNLYVPKDFNFDEVNSESRLNDIEESLLKKIDDKEYDIRLARMKENFIEALSGSFNSEAEKLIKMIRKVDDFDFYQLYMTYDEFDFDYFDTDGQGVSADEKSIGDMEKYIQLYNEGKIENKELWHKNFS